MNHPLLDKRLLIKGLLSCADERRYREQAVNLHQVNSVRLDTVSFQYFITEVVLSSPLC